MLKDSQSEISHQPRLIKNVLVFDVTPKKLATQNNFYSSSNMQQFLTDLVEIVNDLAPSTLLTLKPKRKYNSADDYSYIRLLKSLHSKLKILAPTQDLVLLIREADLVICVPFTSPALLAKLMGKQVFYYSPSLEFNLPLEYEGIRVVFGKKNLRRAISLFVK
jgi:polysaccharide biosynthesis PFTS motif protein